MNNEELEELKCDLLELYQKLQRSYKGLKINNDERYKLTKKACLLVGVLCRKHGIETNPLKVSKDLTINIHIQKGSYKKESLELLIKQINKELE